MKIRIIGAQRPSYWYAPRNRLQDVFEARLTTEADCEEFGIEEGIETNEYTVLDTGNGDLGWVDKRDCVEVE